MPAVVDWPGELGPGQLMVRMVRYPHMLDLDTAVWSAFLGELQGVVGRVWYDVKVGSPIALPPEASEADRRLAEGTGCRRIDAVVSAPGELWVVEVKPLGDHVALGQVLTYVQLFRERYRTAVPIVPMVVCGDLDADMARMFSQHDVRVHVLRVSPWA